MNAKQLRTMLEGIPDNTKIIVATDTNVHHVTGLWFQEGMVVCVAPTLSPEVSFVNDMLSKKRV